MNARRFVIAGTSVYGIENYGDEALLVGLVRQLRSQFPKCHITWVARHPDTRLAAEYGIDVAIAGLEHGSKEESVGRWFNGFNYGDDSRHLHRVHEAVSAADALIIGGDPFQGISFGFGRGLAPYAERLVTLAKFLDVPVVLYSIHIGAPLSDPDVREVTRYCIENAALTLLREEFSLHRLQEAEVDTRNCRVVADTAWTLTHDDATESDVSRNLPDGFILGVNIRHNYWQWSESTWNRLAGTMAGALDEFIQRQSDPVSVVFVPNCTYDMDHFWEDDRNAAEGIAARMKNPSIQIREKLGLFETLGVLRKMDLHVSNRRHSAVFAAALGVPTLPLGSSWHVRPAFEKLGSGRLVQEWEFWDAQPLADLMMEAMQLGKHQEDGTIRAAVAANRAAAGTQGKLISGVLKGA